MNIKKFEIKNARRLSDGGIDCEVLFEGETEYIPYTATATDIAETGKAVWQALQDGLAGDIAPFVMTPEQLDEIRQNKHAEISQWRDEQENAGIIFEWNGHRWDGGKISRSRLAPVVAVAQAGALPAGFFWTDADNQDVTLTPEELVQLDAAMLQAMVIRGFQIHERQRQMKEEVAELDSADAIRRYIVGWGNE
ncbi:TPA: DUF4376 domain-containing protein [Escherichia coli]|uniref:DUF4376 domain-containing protein n=3 Tax=Escherichia coli TaxID=562 RepID=UPI0006A60D51|nr:DUF4376 domain-containing protein [Escherichia coli]HBA6943454.1 DUF4376 domain-containing protein [Escherichia coli]HBA8154813.1 DUF4376 domain-containing protein [Escherichia coli]